jgi:hypothetical protein
MKKILRIGLFLSVVSVIISCGGGGGSDMIPPFWSQGGVVVADLDGDGRQEVAVASTNIAGPPPHPGYVLIYHQSSPGTFEAPKQFRIGPDPWGLSVGDFNGDGWPDLVAAIPSTVPPEPNVIGNSGGISILLQDPGRHGSFLASQWVSTGGAANDAAIAQLTADNLADVVVADSVLVNGRALLLAQSATSPGTFLAPVSLLAGSGRGSEDLAVADINGDGHSDIVLAAYNAVAVFYQRAGGGFDPVVILDAGLVVSGVSVADLDGDGLADIVVANAGNANAGVGGSSSITILQQISLGSFVATEIPVADGARRVAIDDLNGDGLPDIAVVSIVYQWQSVPSRVSVLLQSTANRGQFAVSSVNNGPYSGSFIAIGDSNGDGLNDIVVNDGPSVLLQSAKLPGTFEPLRALR